MDNNPSQLELFSKSGGPQPRPERKSLFGYIRVYEKTVLLIIALIATGIVSYTMGVEKGKRIALSQQSKAARFDMAAVAQDNRAAAESPAPAVMVTPIRTPQNLPERAVSVKSSGSYTIQLASYINRSAAQKEHDALRKKGFSALIISRGKYAVLCVGNFPSKESAQPLLAEFKKRYKTCYVRRL